MLRFNSPTPSRRPRPPAYLGRGVQLRLLSLVVGLALVVAAMDHLRKPEGAAALERVLQGGRQPVAEQDIAVDDLPAPLLSADELTTIEDNTAFRREETDAWFTLFRLLRDVENREPLRPADSPLTYAQLTRQPHVYRGRPVRVVGSVRRVERVAPGENELGIESLYRLVLQGQGGEAWPTTVYALQPPPDVAFGETVNLPAEVVGVFFKNWSYRHQNGLGISPVLVTDRVDMTATAPPPTEPVELPAWQVVGVAAVAAAVCVLIVWRRTRDEDRPSFAMSNDSTPRGGPQSIDLSHVTPESSDR